MLRDNAAAVLVDVRTTAEWHFVGVPDLSSLGRDAIYINGALSTVGPTRTSSPNCRMPSRQRVPPRRGAARRFPVSFRRPLDRRRSSRDRGGDHAGLQRAGRFEGHLDAQGIEVWWAGGRSVCPGGRDEAAMTCVDKHVGALPMLAMPTTACVAGLRG